MKLLHPFIAGIMVVLTGYGIYIISPVTRINTALGSTMTGSAWFLNTSQQIQAGAATWGLRIPSLHSSGDCLVTDANGVVTTGACGTAGGSGTIGTSSPLVAGQLLYATGASTTASVATGTLTTTATGLQFDNTRGVVGGSAVLSLTSGYQIPTTTRMATWDAKGSGTVTSVDMSVPTGLSISGNPVTTTGTLALTLTSGYVIASTTRLVEHDTAYSWGNHALAGYLTSGGSNWLFNGTTLSPSTTVGIGVFASSTIGGGTGATGLTISGGATTTGASLFQSTVTVNSGAAGTTTMQIGQATNPACVISEDAGSGALSYTWWNAGIMYVSTTACN